MKSNSSSSAARKGAWTVDEDLLLTKCIERYGEGKWHKVPHKAGLNRCRKSCRLRWLNYLKPDIKRGDFTMDEVDLMIRLHKLLGNRWSLIAGRLPGRTANDVKNYWNTHQRKKTAGISTSNQVNNVKAEEEMKSGMGGGGATSIIKPRPRNLSKSTHPNLNNETQLRADDNHNYMITSKPTANDDHEIHQWWKKLLVDDDIGSCETDHPPFSTPFVESDINLRQPIDIDVYKNQKTSSATKLLDNFVEQGLNWGDIWDFLNSDTFLSM